MKYIQTGETSAIAKGRGRGLRSMCSSGILENKLGSSFHQRILYASQSVPRISNNTRSNSTLSAAQETRSTIKIPSVLEKDHMQTDVSFSPSTDKVIQSPQSVEPSAIGMGRGRGRELKSLTSSKVSENKVGSFHHNALYASQGMPRTSNSTKSNYTMFAAQEMRTTNVTPSVHEKKHVQTDIAFSPSTGQVMKSSQTFEPSSCTSKVKKVRGSNKCKEVASLEVGQKLKVTFYNNRTVGKNSNLFVRHLGKLVRDRNMCPLGVSSWDDIKEEKLNHMWAAVEDKFESDDMDIHRDHILSWMKELWNKWRGQFHAKYVKGKPIQEALRNVPKGVDKKQWEWLIKEHFSSESFQARSHRNATNRVKLKMLHHIGSKPIREIIYQKGGKDGNPPDLATIFFETRKKNNTLVDFETIEKHAQIQELVMS
uniref:Uncharacterized protein LOC104247059 isoform X1 n=2 Tax=Nicotiana sylvestris TaxID=4096 RepID=A0A1U7YH77_NICSY|nr:PREDICTED: uncharacterized protein LOC104247059 isoform X1 [Nicotiana sylvestris]XP_009801297.1 PREDICTED: uncharacterized protein LOC104247059 isoform X2 [Nicotiana sylvestris]XP_009801298.1 PREDICTED: uncharacterized protein LOC104247059 isoform X2 [Nicotiana sylvestris]